MPDNQKLHVAHPNGCNPQLSTQNRNFSGNGRNFLCDSVLAIPHVYAIQYATGDATTSQQLCNFSGQKWHPKVAQAGAH